jgi:hypothetical protein
MGNELSEPQDIEGRWPPLVVQIESLLWPGVVEVFCNVTLENKNDMNEPIRPFGKFTAPSSPILIEDLGVSSVLRVEIGDSSSGGSPISTLVLPVSRFVEWGLPLYTSLWFGLAYGEDLRYDMSTALERAKEPDSPKLRLALFKPDIKSLYTLSSSQEFNGSVPLKARPDVAGAIMDAVDEGAGCSGREFTQSVPLNKQVEKLIDCLRINNEAVTNLQLALFKQAVLGIPPTSQSLLIPPTSQSLIPSVGGANIKLDTVPSTSESQAAVATADKNGGPPDEEEIQAAIILDEMIWQFPSEDMPPQLRDLISSEEFSAIIEVINADFLAGLAEKWGNSSCLATIAAEAAFNNSAAICSCGSIFLRDAEFCRQCGVRRPVDRLADTKQRLPSTAPLASSDSQEVDLQELKLQLKVFLDQISEFTSCLAWDLKPTNSKTAIIVREKGRSQLKQALILASEREKKILASEREKEAGNAEAGQERQAELIAELGQLQTQNEELRTQQQQQEQQLAVLMEQKDSAQNEAYIEVVQKAEEALEAQKKVEEMTQRGHEWQLALEAEKYRSESAERACAISEQSLKEMEEKLLKAEQGIAQEAGQGDANLRDALQEIGDLKSALQEAEQKDVDLRTALEIEQKDADIAAAMEEVAELRCALQDAGQKDADLKTMLQEAGAVRDTLHQQEVADLKQELGQKDSDLKAALEEVAALRGTLQDSNAECERLQADVSKYEVGDKVISAKMRVDLEVLEDENVALKDSIGKLQKELSDVRLQNQGDGPSQVPASLPNIAQLQQQAERENNWKMAAEARQREIDALNKSLEQESSRFQRELATRQSQDLADLERRQMETMSILQQQTKDSLQRLEDKVATALKQHEDMNLQGARESLQSILSECITVRDQNPLLQMQADTTTDVDGNGQADFTVPPTDPGSIGVDYEVPPTVTDGIDVDYAVPPTATVGIDVNGDGQADYVVSGVDRNHDGIPDALQNQANWVDDGETRGIDTTGDGQVNYVVQPEADLPDSPPESKVPAGMPLDEDKLRVRQGTVRCNRCSALNMINLEGPPTVQCGSCAFEFTALWDDMLPSRVMGSGPLEQVAEESQAEASSNQCDDD